MTNSKSKVTQKQIWEVINDYSNSKIELEFQASIGNEEYVKQCREEADRHKQEINSLLSQLGLK